MVITLDPIHWIPQKFIIQQIVGLVVYNFYIDCVF